MASISTCLRGGNSRIIPLSTSTSILRRTHLIHLPRRSYIAPQSPSTRRASRRSTRANHNSLENEYPTIPYAPSSSTTTHTSDSIVDQVNLRRAQQEILSSNNTVLYDSPPQAFTRFGSRTGNVPAGGGGRGLEFTWGGANADSREVKRLKIMTVAALLGMMGIAWTAYAIDRRVNGDSRIHKADSPASSIAQFQDVKSSDIRILPREGDSVPSGTTSVPPLPKRITIPGEGEYVLIGHGIRTVSFLRVQVYVVGLYVHTSDLPRVLDRVRGKLHPPGTGTMVARVGEGNKKVLLEMFKDADVGGDIVKAVLLDGGVRSVFRIVPTRNTDWAHLRDGWVRGITGKAGVVYPSQTQQSQSMQSVAEGEGDFPTSLATFKQLFTSVPGKSVAKGGTILLVRDSKGGLEVWFDPSTTDVGKKKKEEGGEKGGLKKVGYVPDDRLSWALWLVYLAGQNVSSEEMRGRVVEGLVRLANEGRERV